MFLLAIEASGAKLELKEKRLGDQIFDFLDKNRDKKITIPEMNSQMMYLEKMANEGGEGDENTEELRRIFRGLKRAAPYLFNLMDQDEDRRLDKQEMKFLDTFEESLNKNGNCRIFVKEVFEILDDDVDDRLDADEILEGTKSNFLLGEIANSMHQFFSLRDSAWELKIHIKRAMRSLWGDELDREGVVEGMKWFDTDGDGYIQWLELADIYNSFGNKFIGMAGEIKRAGPMMGMFGDDRGGEKDKAKDAFQKFAQQSSNVDISGLSGLEF